MFTHKEQASPKAGVDQNLSASQLLANFDSFDAENLAKAVENIAVGSSCAAIFSGALSPTFCSQAVAQIESRGKLEHYLGGADDVGRSGHPSLYETQYDPLIQARYFAGALSAIGEMRNIFGDLQNPADRVRAMMDECWPKGARLMRLNGKPCSVGLVRFLDKGGEILPHTDNCCWDVPDSIDAQQVEAQIAFNFHLQTPDQGGEVTIFPKRLTKIEQDAIRLSPPNEYGLDRSKLPMGIIIKPEVGSLVLFEARLPHAVAPCTGRTRYTLSGFIGICRTGQAVLFS